MTGSTVLLGRNGAGKSTLCRLLVGVEKPDSGQVLRDGASIDSGTRRRAHHRATGWLPQSFAALGSLTVEQYVSYAGWLKALSGPELADAVDRAVGATALAGVRGRTLRQLSGGMLRRAGIAQAMVNDPSLLVLDEPTAGLDPEQRGTFHHLISSLAAERTVVISTHLLEDVLAVGQRVLLLDHGLVRFQGTVDQLEQHGEGSGDAATRLRSGFLTAIGAATP